MNPLSKHFRTPALYIKLPSKGKWWPEGAIEYPLSGEIPILPMTSRDEIMLRTPDALLNGEGVVQVIQSCCPVIHDAWKMPSIDVDAVLIAIRIASYGNSMEMSAICPACKEHNDYAVDLHAVMSSIGSPSYDALETKGLKIKLRPQEYFSINTTNMLQFEEQRMLQFIADPSIKGEDRERIFKENLKKLVDINIKVVTDSTEYIETSDGDKVTEPEYISEFYENADRTILADIKDYLETVKEEIDIKPINVACDHCNHEYKLAVTFNHSDFFGQGS